MKKLMLLSLLFFGMQMNASAQVDQYPSLAYGEWIWESNDSEWTGRLLLMDDNSFEMSWSKVDGSEDKVSNGTYTVEGEKLTFIYSDNDKKQVNDIKILNEEKLQFQYIETGYKYKRAGS